MEKKSILHMFTPARTMSPFDINMAVDAGFDVIATQVGVELADIKVLTQDAIFSRGPKGVRRTGIFIGGRDLAQADDMLRAAQSAMVPPFEVSVLADPSGAFTTAAAMVASIEQQLMKLGRDGFRGCDVVVLGGTGPVGAAAGALAAGAGAIVTLTSHSSLDRAQAACTLIKERYGANASAARAASPADVQSLLSGAHVIMAAAKAGERVASAADLAVAKELLVAADVNAVPPAGIEGLDVFANGQPLPSGSGKSVGIGALSIGNVKYQVERGLMQAMLAAEKPLYLDFRAAFESARRHVAGQ